jgi:hypothetical protein
MVPILVLAFIVVPLAELAVIIAVGDAIGLLPTLLLLLAISVAGGWLAKREGLAAWRRFQLALAEGRMPTQEVAARRLRRRRGRVIVEGTARDAGSTRVTWGSPEVGRDGARPDRDPLP